MGRTARTVVGASEYLNHHL